MSMFPWNRNNWRPDRDLDPDSCRWSRPSCVFDPEFVWLDKSAEVLSMYHPHLTYDVYLMQIPSDIHQ